MKASLPLQGVCLSKSAISSGCVCVCVCGSNWKLKIEALSNRAVTNSRLHCACTGLASTGFVCTGVVCTGFVWSGFVFTGFVCTGYVSTGLVCRVRF